MAIKMNYNTAALQVCIDAADTDAVRGRVLGQRLTAPIEFSDVGDFLLKIDALLDAQNFPQAFERSRTFWSGAKREVPAADNSEEALPEDEVSSARGAVDTFTLHILTRRGATWQGFIRWAGSDERQTFNSALELVKLIDQRVSPENV